MLHLNGCRWNAMGRIDSFDLSPGRMLARRFEVIEQIGAGWESEVYLVCETSTGIERTAKLFFPHRNPGNRVARRAATKLHKLRHCPAVVQYVTQEMISVRRQPVTVFVSEFLSGDLLNQFVAAQRGKRLEVFEALHLLHALARALEPIHAMREFHGDLHGGNIFVERRGLGFNVRLIDLFAAPEARYLSARTDVTDLVRVFYDALGGAKRYANHPAVVKQVCKGLKRTLILQQFRNAGELRQFLENLDWA